MHLLTVNDPFNLRNFGWLHLVSDAFLEVGGKMGLLTFGQAWTKESNIKFRVHLGNFGLASDC